MKKKTIWHHKYKIQNVNFNSKSQVTMDHTSLSQNIFDCHIIIDNRVKQ
jgi:hypothetical protein